MELIARNLTKVYGGTTALSGVSFTAASGILALLGPNGSGKSTMLRLLATVSTPDSGEIAFAGRPYSGDLRPLRRVIGYLPQHLEPPDHLTPRDLLRYIARIKGVEAEPQAGVLLEQLGLGRLADRPLGRLSGGQKKRVGIAQTLLGSPRLLLLDEPTAGLDPEERERALRLVCRPVSGRVVVLSSHVPGEVETFARQVVVLRAGEVLYAGTVKGLRRHARGRVYEALVPAAAADQLAQRYPVSRVAQRGVVSVLRVVGDPPAGLDAKAVAGSLEDAYLLLQRGLC